MEDYNDKEKSGEEETQILDESNEVSLLCDLKSDKLPNQFNMTRVLIQDGLQYGDTHYTKVTTLSGESPTEYLAELEGIGKNLSKVTIRQLIMAISKVLYNTNYLMNNQEKGTGLATDKLTNGMGVPSIIYKGENRPVGEIQVKVSDLAADVFGGEANSVQKKEVVATLHAMECMYIEDKERKGLRLLNVYGYTTDKVTKAKVLNIILHPIFAMGLSNNFATHPQDIMARMRLGGRVTDAKMRLLQLLGMQQIDKPYVIYLPDLLEKVGLTKAYAKNKKRALKSLDEAFDLMVKVEMTLDYPKVTNGNKYTFHRNPAYVGNKKDNLHVEEA